MYDKFIEAVTHHFTATFPAHRLYYQYESVSNTLFFVVESDELYKSEAFAYFYDSLDELAAPYSDLCDYCLLGTDRVIKLDNLILSN